MLQCRVITLNRSSPVIPVLTEVFPYADVAVQPGVDMRNADLKSLIRAKLIGYGPRRTILDGRKWHAEMSSTSAIGLAHSLRLALQENTTQPVLVCEDDCYIRNTTQLRSSVESLLQHLDEFDMAVFGPMLRTHEQFPVGFMPANWMQIKGQFMLSHCVLYSPKGRRKVAAALSQPLHMQIDALFSEMSTTDELTVLVETHNPSASQTSHFSSIQAGVCPLCLFSPQLSPIELGGSITLGVVVVLVLVLRQLVVTTLSNR